MFFLIGVVFGVGMAASILVGQNIGAQDVDQAKRVAGTSASFFILAALAISMVGFFASPRLLAWMRTPADALPYAIAYLRVIFVGMPFIFAYAFVTVVFGVGPLPRLGIAGAATATLIANGWGADAIGWSFPLGSLASVALSIAYYRFGRWRSARMLRARSRARRGEASWCRLFDYDFDRGDRRTAAGSPTPGTA